MKNSNAPGNALIECRGLAVGYDGKPVASGLSFAVMPGDYLCIVGENGSGKTTTSGKFAAQLKAEGKNVIMAAADTFRAAAIDQLKAWGERAGVRVIAQAPESDPAAVVYDSIMAAKASGADVIIADTAGRLHTKSNLMDELAKITRVIKREIPEGPSEVLIVLDAVTGQNGFVQAETFSKVMPITGVVLTKFDNTSKGGIVIAIAEKLKMPVRYVGLGEGIDDLQRTCAINWLAERLGGEKNRGKYVAYHVAFLLRQIFFRNYARSD